MMRFALAIALASLAAAGPALAQITLPPGYSIVGTTAGSSLGLPGGLAGLEFSGDGSTLCVGSPATSGVASVHSLPVLRNPSTNQVTGFGAATPLAGAPNIDSGLQFGPAGTLFFTRYPLNGLGELVGTTLSTFALPATTNTVGGLAFVPPGAPNAGDLLVGSFTNGDLFTVSLSNAGGGTFSPTGATLFASLPSGSQGFRFVPAGPNAGDILLINHLQGTLSLIDIDAASGLPTGGASSPVVTTFATGILDPEGLAFDPVTDDLFVTTFGGSPPNSILQITGFPLPPPLTANVATIPTTGGHVVFGIHAGLGQANRPYLLAASASGTSPGTPFGSVVVPLNIDGVTLVVFENTNSPAFSNFFGFTSASGEAAATLQTPAINDPSVVGVHLHFAYALFNPIDFASNAVELILVP